MNRRLVAFVGVFCIAMLVVSVAVADKPDKPGKPDKPPKPPKTPGLTTECIIFADNLDDKDGFDHVYLESVPGETVVVGCCPNAGPAPAYTMTLHNICYLLGGTEEACIPEVSLDGYLFINVLGTPGPNQKYMVKFWTWDYRAGDPGWGDYFFEIRGGDLRDRKTEGPNVTYLNENATLWVYYDLNPTCSFSDSGCNPCVGVEPGCDPLSDDPYCYDPCNEEFSIENVSFVMYRDSDLSLCEE